ncbi:MAG: hypothetical protein OES23_05335 [Nitrosopumilus sp.]|nr:hypothetical protein [Nitrosopumilus sp.]
MNKTSIQLLKQVSKGITDISRLKQILGISDSQFNLLVRDLIEQNYLNKDKEILRINSNPKYALFSKVARRYDIQLILHDSNEVILYSITKPITFEEIQNITGFSLSTIQRAVADFDSVGIIERVQDKIHIKQENEDVFLFAKYLKTEKESTTTEFNSEIIYQDSLRILKKTEKGRKIDGELTGFSLFSDYGIEYHTTYDFYVKQNISLKIEDVLIHAIVSSAKNQNKNEITICMLFYLNNRDKMYPIDIRQTARMYSISDIWLDMEGYLRNNPVTNTQLFLPKTEFEEKAKLYHIPSELYTLPTAYPKLFEDIGSKLTISVNVYLFGGENMRKKGIKPRTKDCDIIVTDEKHGKEFVKSLEKLGYVSLNKLHFTEDDNRIDPFDILEHPTRSRMDLFKTRIARKLLLSDNMIKRSAYENFGKLNLYSLSNEDLFILKAVTLREGDIQDLGLIVQAGDFNWKIVWDELVKQEHDTKTNFSSLILDSIDYLHEQTGISPPFYKKLIRRALDNEIKGIIRENLISLESLVELLKGEDITEKMIRNRIDYLQRTNYLTKISQDNKIFVEAKRKINLNVYSKTPVDSNARMKKYVKTYSEQLRLAPETTKLALEYVDKVTDRGGGIGRKPSGLAATILYVACIMKGEYTTKNDLRYVSGLSQPSFGNLYRLAKNMLGV